MPAPRLTGATLRAARTFSAASPVASLLWATSTKDFRIDELSALSAENRAPTPDSVRPLPAGPPRSFGDGDRPMPAPRRVTSAQLAAAYRDGSADPVTVLERLLERRDYGLALRSPFIELDVERARAEAVASRDRWRSRSPRSPLDGVPVSLKDEVDVIGLPTRGGTSYREAPATRDAWVVQRLRSAGAVVFGKTHATEWGMNPFGASEFFDVPRNPYDADRGAGGSSLGAGVAVSLGFGPVALGSDGGGSIRIPSSLTGVYGLKPTHVRIGRTGDLWGSGTMSHLGPIGASTHDLVEFLAATAGADPDDLSSSNQPHPDIDAWRASLTRGVRGARIGVLRAEWADASPGVAAACERALAALAEAGARVVDVSLPLASFASAMGALIIASESTADTSDDFAAHGAAFGDELTLILRLMSRLSGQDFLRAGRTRAALRRQMTALFQDIDLLALPTTRTVAPRYGRDERGVLDPDATNAMTRYAFLANLTGLPAGTAPVGMADGLPVGLQLVGDAWDEASVLAGLAELERNGVSDIPLPAGYLGCL